MLNTSRESLGAANVGYSSTLAFLVWAIWGGFILHMMLSNYLAVLTQPVYEIPIRNIDDLIGRLNKSKGNL